MAPSFRDPLHAKWAMSSLQESVFLIITYLYIFLVDAWYYIWLACAPGCPVVWASWDWQDAAGACCGPSHRLHLHPRLRQRACPEVHRRGLSHGARTFRHGKVCLTPRIMDFRSELLSDFPLRTCMACSFMMLAYWQLDAWPKKS